MCYIPEKQYTPEPWGGISKLFSFNAASAAKQISLVIHQMGADAEVISVLCHTVLAAMFRGCVESYSQRFQEASGPLIYAFLLLRIMKPKNVFYREIKIDISKPYIAFYLTF